jgi:hypothetical protein
MVEASAVTIYPNTIYPVTVGAGGAASASVYVTGSAGGNSLITSFIAIGGGYGPDYDSVGGNGGSGGGGAEANTRW